MTANACGSEEISIHKSYNHHRNERMRKKKRISIFKRSLEIYLIRIENERKDKIKSIKEHEQRNQFKFDETENESTEGNIISQCVMDRLKKYDNFNDGMINFTHP